MRILKIVAWWGINNAAEDGIVGESLVPSLLRNGHYEPFNSRPTS